MQGGHDGSGRAGSDGVPHYYSLLRSSGPPAKRTSRPLEANKIRGFAILRRAILSVWFATLEVFGTKKLISFTLAFIGPLVNDA